MMVDLDPRDALFNPQPVRLARGHAPSALRGAGAASLCAWPLADLVEEAGQADAGRLRAELRRHAAVDRLLVHGPVRREHGLDAGGEIE